MTTIATTISGRLGQILPAALIAAAAAFGISALAGTATASAQPNTCGEWDIGDA
jgi:hypothetical protein